MSLNRRNILSGGAAAVVAAACGGGGGPAQGQTPPPAEVSHLFCVLRPDSAGRWFVQDDIDHAPVGISSFVEQGPDFLRLFFDRTYSHAGVIQVSTDDSFGDHVSGHSNLGRSNATIRLVANGQVIDPARVWEYVPPAGGGNLWVSVVMVNK